MGKEILDELRLIGKDISQTVRIRVNAEVRKDILRSWIENNDTNLIPYVRTDGCVYVIIRRQENENTYVVTGYGKEGNSALSLVEKLFSEKIISEDEIVDKFMIKNDYLWMSQDVLSASFDASDSILLIITEKPKEDLPCIMCEQTPRRKKKASQNAKKQIKKTKTKKTPRKTKKSL